MGKKRNNEHKQMAIICWNFIRCLNERVFSLSQNKEMAHTKPYIDSKHCDDVYFIFICRNLFEIPSSFFFWCEFRMFLVHFVFYYSKL